MFFFDSHFVYNFFWLDFFSFRKKKKEENDGRAGLGICKARRQKELFPGRPGCIVRCR